MRALSLFSVKHFSPAQIRSRHTQSRGKTLLLTPSVSRKPIDPPIGCSLLVEVNHCQAKNLANTLVARSWDEGTKNKRKAMEEERILFKNCLKFSEAFLHHKYQLPDNAIVKMLTTDKVMRRTTKQATLKLSKAHVRGEAKGIHKIEIVDSQEFDNLLDGDSEGVVTKRDGEHSPHSYAGFLLAVEEWKKTVLKDAKEDSKLKPWSSPLDDEIQCAIQWMEEPDRLKVILTSTNRSSSEVIFQAARNEAGGREYDWSTRPMAVSEALIELQKPDLREHASLVLSSYLIQEIREVHPEFSSNELTVRTSERIVNVLNLLKCIAANKETRGAFLEALPPNYLIPLILSEYTDYHYEIVRLVSLSVIGVICKDLEEQAVTWALENDVILACRHAIQIGGYVSKLVSSVFAKFLTDS